MAKGLACRRRADTSIPPRDGMRDRRERSCRQFQKTTKSHKRPPGCEPRAFGRTQGSPITCTMIYSIYKERNEYVNDLSHMRTFLALAAPCSRACDLTPQTIAHIRQKRLAGRSSRRDEALRTLRMLARSLHQAGAWITAVRVYFSRPFSLQLDAYAGLLCAAKPNIWTDIDVVIGLYGAGIEPTRHVDVAPNSRSRPKRRDRTAPRRPAALSLDDLTDKLP